MKTLIKILLPLFLITNLCLGQSTKILTRQFPTSTNLISVDFTNQIVVKKSKEQYPRIFLTIESKLSSQTLDALVKSGRYDYETKIEGDQFIITMPKLSRKIIIAGEEISEKISVEIHLPENMSLENTDLL